MFGKPHWFRPKAIGWGLVPITWRGWLYAGAWSGAITLPFLLLVSRDQPLEAMAWISLALGALTYDVRQILRAYNSPPTHASASPHKSTDDVFYIGDSRPGQPLATRNYNLQLRG